MTGSEFTTIMESLPSTMGRSNVALGKVLGVSHHSVSNYRNSETEIPQYISNAMIMLALICQNNLHTLLLVRLADHHKPYKVAEATGDDDA